MRDGWIETTLGEVAEVVGGGTPKTKEPSYWSGDVLWVTPTEVTAQEGKVITGTERTITEEGLASSSAKLLPAGAVLLTSRATIGATAMTGVPMATNQGFASLVARDGVLAEYLMYWCQAHTAEFVTRASGNTFLEISKTKVKSMPIALPPLGEQVRIADLVAAIDGEYSSAVRVADAATELRGRVLQDRLGAAPRSQTTVGDLASVRSGPSWKAADESPDERPGGLPVVKITNTRPNGEVVMDERAWVTGLPESTPVLEPHSLIVIRTNGNRDRIGNVYKATPEVVGHTISAFQFALTPNSEEDTEFIFRFLQTPSVQREITDSASGTTGLGNVAVRWLRALALPDLTPHERTVVCQTADDLDGVASAARSEADALLALRASLLNELLSGEHEIPASYDELLERAS